MGSVPLEDVEQITFVNEFRKSCPDVLMWHTPNGGFRHAATAARMKQLGQLAGVPDLFIPEWKLFIEMKRTKGGRLSPVQKDVISYLESVGYTVIIGKGWQDAMQQVKLYRGESL